METHHEELLTAKFLGKRFAGRRFLRYAELVEIALVNNRETLTRWMDAGLFPRAARIAGPTGNTLLWPVFEIVEMISARLDEREREACPSNPDDTREPVMMGARS
jgi:hypothetical protein